MQFSPALPWAAGTRGTITLQEPVSKADLLNGALTFVNGNGVLYVPEENDGYVDYYEDVEEGQIVFSIAIGDDEELNVIELSTGEGDIDQIIKSPALGLLTNLSFKKDDLSTPEIGDECFLVAECLIDNVRSYAAITQDGNKVISAVKVSVPDATPVYRILNRGVPTPVNSLLKIDAKTPTGDIASLPMMKAVLASFNNVAALKIMHAPADNIEADNAAALVLNKTVNLDLIYWGDSVTQIYVLPS